MKRFLPLLLILTLSCVAAGTVLAAPQPPARKALPQLIDDGQAALQDAKIPRLAVAVLAVADLTTSKITVVPVETRTHMGKKKFGQSANPAFVTRHIKGEGIYAEYAVDSPPGHIVVAVKRASGEIRTPVTAEIKTPAVIARGEAVLQSAIRTASKELISEKVPSACVTGRFAAQTVPRQITGALPLVEALSWKLATDLASTQKLIDDVYAQFGANPKTAYTRTKSPKGAQGPFQIVPWQYAGIRKLYPTAKLPETFEDAVRDLTISAKVAILTSDDNLCQLKTRRQEVTANPEELGKFLAAAYNTGGPTASTMFHIAHIWWPSASINSSWWALLGLSNRGPEAFWYVNKYVLVRQVLAERALARLYD